MGMGHRKKMVGFVSSARMDKTVVVRVERPISHRLYGKAVRRTKKLVAHDKDNRCKEGDRVMVEETRPLSRTKRWRVIEIVEEAREAAGG